MLNRNKIWHIPKLVSTVYLSQKLTPKRWFLAIFENFGIISKFASNHWYRNKRNHWAILIGSTLLTKLADGGLCAAARDRGIRYVGVPQRIFILLKSNLIIKLQQNIIKVWDSKYILRRSFSISTRQNNESRKRKLSLKGTFYKLRWQERGEKAKCQLFYISLCSKLRKLVSYATEIKYGGSHWLSGKCKISVVCRFYKVFY